MLALTPSVQSPRAYDLAHLQAAALGARLAAGANPAMRGFIRAALQDTGSRYSLDAAEVAAGLVEADLVFGFEVGDVRRYGADPTGVADSFAAIQAAIDVAAEMAAGVGGFVVFPEGTFRCTDELLVASNRVHLRGAGMYATRIVFDPAANGTLLTYDRGASQSVQCSLADLTLWSDDATYVKTALDVYDTVQFTCRNVVISGSIVTAGTQYWSDGTDASIGLRARGREFGIFRNLFISADRPLLLSPNPNISVIGADHFHFTDIYLIANANPCVEVEDGVVLSNVTFDGAQPWVKGTHGLYWVDASNANVSFAVSLKNVRTEQGTSAAADSIHIDLTGSPLQSLLVENSYLDNARDGIYLRGVETITLDNAYATGGVGRTNLDITFTATVQLELVNSYAFVGGTVTLTNAVLVRGSPFNANEVVIPKSALYRYNEAAVISQRPEFGYGDRKHWSYTGALAQSGTLSTPITRALYTAAIVKVAAYSATGPIHCGGSAVWTKNGGMTKIGGSANFVTAGVTTPELRVIDGGSGLVVVNVLGQDVTIMIDVEFV